MLVSPLQAQDLYITLLNGDCDGDNEVTLFDFGIVVSAMGSVPGDPNWDPRADLDGDGEVTLFDFGIVERNFGQVGAEPFDPTLPRLPAPSEGYSASGRIQIEAWEGEPVRVRIESLREDEAQPIVYWKEVWTGQFFTLFLPDSGPWMFRVEAEATVLTAAPRLPKFYAKGEPIRILARYPAIMTDEHGTEILENFADAVFDPAPIGLKVVPVDYDFVEVVAADGTRFPPNREREVPQNLVCYWQLRSGRGALVPATGSGNLHSAQYYPEELYPWQTEQEVIVECTVVDSSPVESRKDEPVTAVIRFKIVNTPTLHISAHAHPIGGTPVASAAGWQFAINFVASARLGTCWQLADSEVHWTTPWGRFTGRNILVPITTEEEHRRFPFKADATFRRTPLPPPVPPEEITDTKYSSCILGFHRYYYDEQIDPARGASIAGTCEPPNWFDNRRGHWGHILDRYGFNKTDPNLAGQYVVHYAPEPFRELLDELPRDRPHIILAVLYWQGAYAPPEHRYEEAYRGRIYIFEVPTVRVYDDFNLYTANAGLTAGGVDLVARVTIHEYAHRDMFKRGWNSFRVEDIGGTRQNNFTDWKPGSKNWFDGDLDGDLLNDGFESKYKQTYHCSHQHAYSIAIWFTKDTTHRVIADYEMLSLLWGEWGDPGSSSPYTIGELDIQDWSVGGRQDY